MGWTKNKNIKNKTKLIRFYLISTPVWSKLRKAVIFSLSGYTPSFNNVYKKITISGEKILDIPVLFSDKHQQCEEYSDDKNDLHTDIYMDEVGDIVFCKVHMKNLER